MQMYRAKPEVGIEPKPKVTNEFKLRVKAFNRLTIKPAERLKKGLKYP